MRYFERFRIVLILIEILSSLFPFISGSMIFRTTTWSIVIFSICYDGSINHERNQFSFNCASEDLDNYLSAAHFVLSGQFD